MNSNPFQENITAQNKPVDPDDLEYIKSDLHYRNGFCVATLMMLLTASMLFVAACVLYFVK